MRCAGNTALLRTPAIGICGSRHATEAALGRAERFGEIAAALHLVVVSGNAKGVDDHAALGALRGGGQVAAVLGEGLRRWKPRVTHRTFLTGSNFVAVSEFDDDASWQVSRAMQRNKLIVALSRSLVVVQAGTSGGTWNAGLECLRQHRPLIVVQEARDSSETEGNRQLLSRGGIAVTTNKELCTLLERIRDEPGAWRLPQGQLL